MDPDNEDLQQYEHIYQNEFSYRKHKKQKEEDIAICECKFDFSDPDSACGERCLNVLTSTECTPGYCPCGVYCKNQKFQKCQYPRTTLLKTEGRGWGLRASENIKAGQFIIEYCGEVISWKEAKRRSQAYEALGLKDAYIISLNGTESIDATKKGSLARFINHSCQPNCETRKWTVLGEIRVGIFAKQDIPIGTELAYDYNFEWYGGAKVRCLCRATGCSGFLGAKSRGFQEDTYVWEDDDERYSVEKIPLYDSAEDEPEKKLIKSGESDVVNDVEIKQEPAVTINDNIPSANHLELEPTTVVDDPVHAAPMGGRYTNALKTETTEDVKLYADEVEKGFSQKNGMISRIRSNSACRNYHIKMGPTPKKRSRDFTKLKSKPHSQKQVEAKQMIQLLSSKEAQEEVVAYEEKKNAAASQLSSLYDEIRPAIEEHERDNQDSVATSVGEKWINVHCLKLKTEFDFFSSIVKNIVCNCTPHNKPLEQSKVSDVFTTDEVKYLEL